MSDDPEDNVLDITRRLRERKNLEDLAGARETGFEYGVEYSKVYRKGERQKIEFFAIIPRFCDDVSAITRRGEGTLSLYIGSEEPVYDDDVLVPCKNSIQSDVLQFSDKDREGRIMDFSARWLDLVECLDLLSENDDRPKQEVMDMLADGYRDVILEERELAREFLSLDDYKLFVGEVYEALEKGGVYVSVLAVRTQDRVTLS